MILNHSDIRLYASSKVAIFIETSKNFVWLPLLIHCFTRFKVMIPRIKVTAMRASLNKER